MKMSRSFLTALVMISAATATLMASSSKADTATQTIFSCQESAGKSLVTESAKQLTIEKDSNGQLTMTVAQKDSASETRVLMNSSVVNEIYCNGYGPCRMFVSDSIRFFINFYSNPPYEAGHLEAIVDGQNLSASFLCSQNQK
jgi:hypothetical protein